MFRGNFNRLPQDNVPAALKVFIENTLGDLYADDQKLNIHKGRLSHVSLVLLFSPSWHQILLMTSISFNWLMSTMKMIDCLEIPSLTHRLSWKGYCCDCYASTRRTEHPATRYKKVTLRWQFKVYQSKPGNRCHTHCTSNVSQWKKQLSNTRGWCWQCLALFSHSSVDHCTYPGLMPFICKHFSTQDICFHLESLEIRLLRWSSTF